MNFLTTLIAFFQPPRTLLDRLRERSGTDLPDAEIEAMIAAIGEELDARFGPAGARTIEIGDPAQDAGTLPLTFAGTNLFDLFKFNAGLSAERFMLWDNATADVTLAATRELFVKAGGGLADPLTAVNALGTPLISFFSDSLQTGVNAGSGGDWTYS